jgi:serine/threonine protein kinase/ABC-type multidrug transport system ATPase subunit/pSer/pThr/pTyr-binding forkhead associated (FHA) protein
MSRPGEGSKPPFEVVPERGGMANATSDFTAEVKRGIVTTRGRHLGMTTLEGQLIADRYIIGRELGRGGMGAVYDAHDRVLDERVALKVLAEKVQGDAEAIRRFRSEIKLARRIRHPNVCAIHEYGEFHGLLYIVMEFIDGQDLKAYLKAQGLLTPEEAIGLVGQMGEGLQAMHDAGVIHRDLKLANVMRDRDGRLRLMDLGIARGMFDVSMTSTGAVLGTPPYMSPEQIRGQRVDSRTDIYSLGIMTYELLTGRLPFGAREFHALVYAHVHEPPPLDDPTIPRGLASVLAKALAKKADERYESARAFAAALVLRADGSEGERDDPGEETFRSEPTLGGAVPDEIRPHEVAPFAPPQPTIPLLNRPRVPLPPTPPLVQGKKSARDSIEPDPVTASGYGYRLVGIGRRTEGLFHELSDGKASVLGRAPECSLPIPDEVGDGAKTGLISRTHAVVELTAANRWSLHDDGSTNGTALLRQGIPPTILLETARLYPLESGDVIELASCADYQFLFQSFRRDVHGGPPPTRTVFRRAVRSVQYLIDGHAVSVHEVDFAGVHVCRAGASGIRLGPPSEPMDVLMRFSAGDGKVRLEARSADARVNEEPVPRGTSAVLRDMDLITTEAAPRAALLFFDPEAIEPRCLSDLLLGAGRVTIGSAEDNTCRLGDPSVSRHHAIVWKEGTSLRVRDLGSTNGTLVNDRRVLEDSVLTQGSRMWIGRLPFVVDAGCFQPDRVVAPSVDIRFLNVTVEVAGKPRLRDLSFGVGQGEMVGVLGPSASGKSTLLRALAGQLRMTKGDIYVNGRSIQKGDRPGQWFKALLGFGPDTREVGFVQQIDLLQPDLTVREILQFAARQMGRSPAEAQACADQAASQCNLGKLLERVPISATGQMNLSGGQLKRVCVALEVLRQPRVMVLDEPTTGQDPKNTADLLGLFRRLANGGVTLLLSTHDLSSLEYFDKVIVVCLGYLTYFGPPSGFAAHFGAETAEKVYNSLPDNEDRLAEAENLAELFRATPLFQQHCRVEA